MTWHVEFRAEYRVPRKEWVVLAHGTEEHLRRHYGYHLDHHPKTYRLRKVEDR